MDDLETRIEVRKNGRAEKQPKADMSKKHKISTGRALKYMFLPELGSRIRGLSLRIGGFAYFLAQIFYSCRLIPAGHPVLQSSNIGYFGFSDVISTAASNLTLKRDNLDQIIMFSAVMISMVLLVANGLAIAAYTVLDFGSAMAAEPATTTAAGSLFTAPHPESDLALIFLDRVFGTGVFMAANDASKDTAIQTALYHMLGVYSTAMMVIAVIIVLYYAFTVVGESAMTGQPFGKRFNSFWAPIRLVIGLGLLVPIAGGLNAAQYVTLYAAKMGSGLASYSWTQFVDTMKKGDLISAPRPYAIQSALAAIAKFETCRAVHNIYNEGDPVTIYEADIQPPKHVDLKRVGQGGGGAITNFADTVATTMPGTPTGLMAGMHSMMSRGWNRATNNYYALTLTDKDPSKPIGKKISWRTMSSVNSTTTASEAASKVPGTILDTNIKSNEIRSNLPAPECGELTISWSSSADPLQEVIAKYMGMGDGNGSTPGGYWKWVKDVALEMRPAIEALAVANGNAGRAPAGSEKEPDISKLSGLMAKYQAASDKIQQDALAKFKDKLDQMQQDMGVYDNWGWLGAGLFYQSLSRINGILVSGMSMSFPKMTSDVGMPGITTGVAPTISDYQATFNTVTAKVAAVVGTFTAPPEMNDMQYDLQAVIPDISGLAIPQEMKSVDMFIHNAFGGIYFSLFRSEEPTNPMAQLAQVGRGIMLKSNDLIKFVMGKTWLEFTKGIPVAGGFANIATMMMGLYIFAALAGIVTGFMLYFILPMSPFIFFIFAFFNWVLMVIEALVGLPLWALSHLRIDGEGLMGQQAQAGYNMIFQIVIFPFSILFATVITFIFFNNGAMLIREVFSLYVSTVNDGENGLMDYTIYSGLYVLMIYILANLSFKQIDQMHNVFMRWMGASVQGYDDGQADPTEIVKSASTQAAGTINALGQRL